MAETLSPALPPDVERRAHHVLKRACDLELRIAVAESCTGGLLASLLTDVDGMGHAFERGFVVYSEAAKTELLGVPRTMLERDGAVSESVARAMAEGGLARSNADVCISITGFAGRAGAGDEPGLVHFAAAAKGARTKHLRERFGDLGRGGVRLAALRVALEMLSEAIDARADR